MWRQTDGRRTGGGDGESEGESRFCIFSEGYDELHMTAFMYNTTNFLEVIISSIVMAEELGIRSSEEMSEGIPKGRMRGEEKTTWTEDF